MSDSGPDEYANIAELYDYVDIYRNRPDIEFYVAAAVESRGPVLEVGCGTGRVLIPTSRAGVEITGLDASPHMLGVCRRRMEPESAETKARIQLVQGDMRDFTIAGSFALATIPFRPFQHLTTVADQLACLGCIRRHLADNGLLVFDLFNPSLDALANRQFGVELDEEPAFTTPDGRRVVRRHKTVSADRFSQVSRFELVYYVAHADGREERLVHAFDLRHTFRFEIEHLLARAGFVLEQLYAGYDRSAYGSKYPGDLVLVARKRAPPSI